MKIVIENIMKVADVHNTSISEDVQHFLQNECTETYRDMMLTENIYNLSDILENNEGNEPEESVKLELEKINKQISKRGCAYLRIIF